MFSRFARFASSGKICKICCWFVVIALSHFSLLATGSRTVRTAVVSFTAGAVGAACIGTAAAEGDSTYTLLLDISERVKRIEVSI